jgi:hypothetical protein
VPAPPGAPGAAGSTGKGRLGLVLAGALAVVALVGAGVVVAGGDDEPAANESSADDPATSGGASDDPAGDNAGDDAGDDADGAGEAPDDGLPGADDESPVEVAEAFFAAATSGDCAGVVDRMTVESYSTEGQTAAEAVDECEDDVAGAAALAEAEFGPVELVSEDGDRAVVSVTVGAGDDAVEREMPMRRIDGEWKMHLDTSLTAPAG